MPDTCNAARISCQVAPRTKQAHRDHHPDEHAEHRGEPTNSVGRLSACDRSALLLRTRNHPWAAGVPACIATLLLPLVQIETSTMQTLAREQTVRFARSVAAPDGLAFVCIWSLPPPHNSLGSLQMLAAEEAHLQATLRLQHAKGMRTLTHGRV
jgi:hypothetical protein